MFDTVNVLVVVNHHYKSLIYALAYFFNQCLKGVKHAISFSSDSVTNLTVRQLLFNLVFSTFDMIMGRTFLA